MLLLVLLLVLLMMVVVVMVVVLLQRDLLDRGKNFRPVVLVVDALAFAAVAVAAGPRLTDSQS